MSEWFNESHDRFYTPHRAILATGGVTALLILLGLRVETIISLLAEAASFSFLVAYLLVHVSIVVFRRADPDEYEPTFELPGVLYPLVPILGVLMTVVVISQMATIIIVIGSGIIGLGIVWYVAYARTRAIGSGLVRDAITSAPGEPYRVIVPIANPETQHGLLRLAAATAHANEAYGTPELVAINVIEGTRDDPRQNIESERLEHQRDLLQNAHVIAEEMDVELRTRAMVAPEVSTGLLDVIAEEDPDQLLIGWDGVVGDGEYTFGHTIDPVIQQAQCDISLVKLVEDSIGTPVALVAPGENASSVVRRAFEFASVDDTVPTLLYVHPPDAHPDADTVTAGREILDDIARSAGLESDEYDAEVLVSDDIETAIPAAIEAYDTVCIGLSHRTDSSGILYGAFTEQIALNATGNVGLVRGAVNLPDR